MECLSYVDLSHDYSKSIIFNNMSPHYRHMYLYPPPFKLCHPCQIYMKPQVRPAGPISWFPLLPHSSESSAVTGFDHVLPLLVPIQLLHLSSSLPSFAGNTYLKQEIYFLIWNWIRSCSSINSPMICYEARHSPPADPLIDWPSLWPQLASASKGWRQGQHFKKCLLI